MSAAYSLVAHILLRSKEEYAYDIRIKIPERIAPKRVQNFVPRRISIQVAMAPKNAMEANVLIPPKPVAPPGFDPDHGSSRSVPINHPRASARRKPINTEGSIKNSKDMIRILYRVSRRDAKTIKKIPRQRRDFLG